MLVRFLTAAALCTALTFSAAHPQQRNTVPIGRSGEGSSLVPSAGRADQVSAVPRQQPGQWLARNILGKPVFNAQEERIGTLRDLLLDDENRVIAAVIRIGGFLGFGGRDVAVRMDQIHMHEDALAAVLHPGEPPLDSDMVLSLNATRDQVRLMPIFLSLREIERSLVTDARGRHMEDEN